MAKKKNKNLTIALWIIGIIVAVIIIIIVAQSPTTSNNNGDDGVVPSSIVKDITSVKSSIFSAVGVGSATNLPKKINAPTLTKNGKPELLYVGAEYCPYCATERWAMVIALSQFGTFSGLKETHSSTTDVYPNTQTFSFHGSTFTSNYLTFTPVEQYSNIPSGSGYSALDPLTSQEKSLFDKYDAAPYTTSGGSIPFIDFGGKYLVIGATYNPQVLQGKSYSQIAGSLSDSSNSITKGAVGSANVLTAAICGITNNQPSNVCTTSTIQTIEEAINE
jgi:hypothetical protein